MNGVFLPIVTPFQAGKVDLAGYERLVQYYMERGISGLVPLGTTGEQPTLEEDECLALVEATIKVVQGRVPIYVGVSSNSTKKAVGQVEKLSKFHIDGFLVTSPYYSLPSQDGIVEHYRAISASTDKSILVYNIPHRTGRNMTNPTLKRLWEIPNIVGVKDTCGVVAQTIELLRDKPDRVSVLAGDDLLYFLNATSGGNGGILASAHFQTEAFVEVWRSIERNDVSGALKVWNRLSKFIPLLFQEPSPGPIKYVLQKKGLIESSEVRLPMTEISDELKVVLDALVAEGQI